MKSLSLFLLFSSLLIVGVSALTISLTIGGFDGSLASSLSDTLNKKTFDSSKSYWYNSSDFVSGSSGTIAGQPILTVSNANAQSLVFWVDGNTSLPSAQAHVVHVRDSAIQNDLVLDTTKSSFSNGTSAVSLADGDKFYFYFTSSNSELKTMKVGLHCGVSDGSGGVLESC